MTVPPPNIEHRAEHALSLSSSLPTLIGERLLLRTQDVIVNRQYGYRETTAQPEWWRTRLDETLSSTLANGSRWRGRITRSDWIVSQGEFIGGGGAADVFKVNWKDPPEQFQSLTSRLPDLAIKTVRVPLWGDPARRAKGLKVRNDRTRYVPYSSEPSNSINVLYLSNLSEKWLSGSRSSIITFSPSSELLISIIIPVNLHLFRLICLMAS